MRQYLDLAERVLEDGYWQTNRTGIRCRVLPGQHLRFDLAEHFPAITTRRLAFKSAMGELVAFLRASTNAARFRELGTKVWDANANQNAQWLANPYREGEDDLGPVYGAQWRAWPAFKRIDATHTARLDAARAAGYRAIGTEETPAGPVTVLHREIDQLRGCLDAIVTNPTDRRILFHAWNPAMLDAMALPPCPMLVQFHPNVEARELSTSVFIRSSDIGLGLVANLVQYSALLALMAKLSGYTPRFASFTLADAHVYENQIPMITEQLAREPFEAPRLVISDRIPDMRDTGRYEPRWLDQVEPSDFALEGYRHHPPLTAPMAV